MRRYMPSEPGAARVAEMTRPTAAHQHVVSRLLPTEMASALALKVRTGDLLPELGDKMWDLFHEALDAGVYEIVELTPPVWLLAQDLLFRHPLRAGDAIHLAAAMVIPSREFTFWTADRRQAAAATAEGLAVELVG